MGLQQGKISIEFEIASKKSLVKRDSGIHYQALYNSPGF